MPLTDVMPGNAAYGVNSAVSSKANPVNIASSGRALADDFVTGWIIKPAAAQGFGGFVFDYEGETQLTADSDVTDHYTESNRFFEDHMALKPLDISMRGFKGELVINNSEGILGLLSILQNKLTELPSILGKYTPGALSKVQNVVTKATSAVNKVDSAISRAQNLVGLISKGLAAPTAIEKAYAQLMGMRETRQVFTVVSPWGILAGKDPFTGRSGPKSFVLKRLVVMADENTKSWIDISVTLKEVRFADISGSKDGQTPCVALASNSGRAAFQRQGPTDKGRIGGTPLDFGGPMSGFGPVQ